MTQGAPEGADSCLHPLSARSRDEFRGDGVAVRETCTWCHQVVLEAQRPTYRPVITKG